MFSSLSVVVLIGAIFTLIQTWYIKQTLSSIETLLSVLEYYIKHKCMDTTIEDIGYSLEKRGLPVWKKWTCKIQGHVTLGNLLSTVVLLPAFVAAVAFPDMHSVLYMMICVIVAIVTMITFTSSRIVKMFGDSVGIAYDFISYVLAIHLYVQSNPDVVLGEKNEKAHQELLNIVRSDDFWNKVTHDRVNSRGQPANITN